MVSRVEQVLGWEAADAVRASAQLDGISEVEFLRQAVFRAALESARRRLRENNQQAIVRRDLDTTDWHAIDRAAVQARCHRWGSVAVSLLGYAFVGLGSRGLFDGLWQSDAGLALTGLFVLLIGYLLIVKFDAD